MSTTQTQNDFIAGNTVTIYNQVEKQLRPECTGVLIERTGSLPTNNTWALGKWDIEVNLPYGEKAIVSRAILEVGNPNDNFPEAFDAERYLNIPTLDENNEPVEKKKRGRPRKEKTIDETSEPKEKGKRGRKAKPMYQLKAQNIVRFFVNGSITDEDKFLEASIWLEENGFKEWVDKWMKKVK